MKLWVDDLRPAPDSTWTVARSFGAAVSKLYSAKQRNLRLEAISLDHDLGETSTGYDLLKLVVEYGWWPDVLTFHTSNVVGRENMSQLARRYAPKETEVW